MILFAFRVPEKVHIGRKQRDGPTYKADFAYISNISHPHVPPTNISVVNNCGEVLLLTHSRKFTCISIVINSVEVIGKV
jgi:hypothetical protein